MYLALLYLHVSIFHTYVPFLTIIQCFHTHLRDISHNTWPELG